MKKTFNVWLTRDSGYRNYDLFVNNEPTFDGIVWDGSGWLYSICHSVVRTLFNVKGWRGGPRSIKKFKITIESK